MKGLYSCDRVVCCMNERVIPAPFHDLGPAWQPPSGPRRCPSSPPSSNAAVAAASRHSLHLGARSILARLLLTSLPLTTPLALLLLPRLCLPSTMSWARLGSLPLVRVAALRPVHSMLMLTLPPPLPVAAVVWLLHLYLISHPLSCLTGWSSVLISLPPPDVRLERPCVALI